MIEYMHNKSNIWLPVGLKGVPLNIIKEDLTWVKFRIGGVVYTEWSDELLKALVWVRLND